MTDSLSNYVRVKGRFHRSVNLVRDFQDKRSNEGYILTQTARDLAQRILEALSDNDAPRSWTITGPYGSGKSSFALFLANLLCSNSKRSSLYKGLKPDRYKSKKPFATILLEGRRDTISSALLQGLSVEAENWSISRKLAKRIKAALKAKYLDQDELLYLFDEFCEEVTIKDAGGLLVIIDEFGKFLEYASLHPDEEDLQIMQGLAEISARSKKPFLLFTILHQSFESYLPAADQLRRSEWAKIQGRFVDAIFLEPASQMLQLIAEALEVTFPKEIEEKYGKQLTKLLRVKDLKEFKNRVSIEEHAPACIPMHPLASGLLWPIFRGQLAQNERSLFSFLTSNEPFGFQDFLQNSELTKHLQFYTPDQLFDYINSALGPAVYQGNEASKWRELLTALNRIKADAPLGTDKVLKVTGIIMIYGGSIGLRANKSTISTAICDNKLVNSAIKYLTDNSIIIYRKFQDSFALWEGSDVNVEAEFEKGLDKVRGYSLLNLTTDSLDIQPVIARGHYFETGTLRAFEVKVIEGSSEDNLNSIELNNHDRDGQIIFILSQSEKIRKTFIKAAIDKTAEKASPEAQPLIFVFPKVISGLEQSLVELEAWKWVAQNTQALNSDRAARTEVASRLSYSRNKLGEIAGSTFGLRGHLLDPSISTWIYDGEILKLSSSRSFFIKVSDICDEVFHYAPTVLNELINRDVLSSAAAAARNNLLKAMLLHPDQYRFGIEGTPPEVSIYESIIAGGGFHKKYKGKFSLKEPTSDWLHVWKAIKEFLESTKKQRKSIQLLYNELKLPPYGVREGLLPILLILAIKIFGDKVALYSKEGVLIPEIRNEVIELLIRNPGDFEIQQISLDRSKKETLKQIAKILEKSGIGQSEGNSLLLDVVKPLIIYTAKLPQFSKNTKTLSSEAIAIRDILLKTKDPNKLLFDDIPKILGVSSGKNQAREISQGLERIISELSGSYKDLLDKIERQIRSALVLKGSSSQIIRQLKIRAEAIIPYAAEPVLALFVREASRINDRDWREVLGRVVLKGIPPDRWTDHDAVEFQMRLQQLQSDFIRLEELVAEKQKLPSGQIVRIGLLDGKLEELREIISITEDQETDVHDLHQRILAYLDSETDEESDSENIILAALARTIARHIERKNKYVE